MPFSDPVVRRAYQRELMRKRRAAAKMNAGGVRSSLTPASAIVRAPAPRPRQHDVLAANGVSQPAPQRADDARGNSTPREHFVSVPRPPVGRAWVPTPSWATEAVEWSPEDGGERGTGDAAMIPENGFRTDQHRALSKTPAPAVTRHTILSSLDALAKLFHSPQKSWVRLRSSQS